jgi:hypothetical protein
MANLKRQLTVLEAERADVIKIRQEELFQQLAGMADFGQLYIPRMEHKSNFKHPKDASLVIRSFL